LTLSCRLAGNRLLLNFAPTIITLSKIEQVRQAILSELVSGRMKAGQRLLEAKLASELGVSQATVNAALQDLHNQGLVTKLLNRSTTVNHYTRAGIEKLFAVRVVLESAAASAAAACWRAEGQARLREQVEMMRRAARAKDLSRFCLADYAFHQELYRLSDNSFLIQACQAIAVAPFAYILCDSLHTLPADYLALAEDHQDMILAMKEGPETAAQVTRKRIEDWLNYSLRALRSASSNGGGVAHRA
jgi:DNA-binding GntR family transcriptional regulator